MTLDEAAETGQPRPMDDAASHRPGATPPATDASTISTREWLTAMAVVVIVAGVGIVGFLWLVVPLLFSCGCTSPAT
jgi:hypothetical protein